MPALARACASRWACLAAAIARADDAPGLGGVTVNVVVLGKLVVIADDSELTMIGLATAGVLTTTASDAAANVGLTEAVLVLLPEAEASSIGMPASIEDSVMMLLLGRLCHAHQAAAPRVKTAKPTIKPVFLRGAGAIATDAALVEAAAAVACEACGACAGNASLAKDAVVSAKGCVLASVAAGRASAV